MDEEIKKSIDEFMKRPIHKVLTMDIINQTADDKLLQVVFDNLSEKIIDHNKEEYEIVTSWNKSRQAIYLAWILIGDVDNGGYNQFYENTGGQFNELLPSVLQLIGADEFATLTDRVNEAYQKDKEDIPEDYDDEFYQLDKKQSLYQLQTDYVLKNKTDFIDS